MASDRRGCLVAALLLGVAAAADAQAVIVSGVRYESPALLAPVAVLSVRRAGATEWRVGVTGWTVSGAWTRTLSPSRAVSAELEVTPVNAHSSNRMYVDGVADPALAYRNSTLQVGGGIRLTPSPRWTTELRGVVLREVVGALPGPVLDLWSSPYVGVDVAQRYDRVSADDVIRSRFEGVRIAARAQVYAGAWSWGRGAVSLGAGRRVGRLFLRTSGSAVSGRSLNTVSAFLTGGSWDVAGPTALYGYPYGAFRLQRAVLANGGADVLLWGSTEIGVRAAWLRGTREAHRGTALSLATLWKGIGISAALAVPEDDALRGRWDRALIAGGITAAVFR